MTSSDIIPMIPPTGVDYEGLRTLQAYCYEQSRIRGFHDLPDEMHEHTAQLRADGKDELADYIDMMYLGNRLMLIVGEGAEAHEEERKGNAPDDTYYSTGTHDNGTLRKPEGVPSELADILIRVLDHAGELNIDLAGIVREKLEYNASRINMHGKKF
jgi:NTP pyrophosphatase (non-canonical NTP hydrolase)